MRGWKLQTGVRTGRAGERCDVLYLLLAVRDMHSDGVRRGRHVMKP